MPLTRFAFIVKGLGYEPRQHRSILESPSFVTHVVGVSNIDDALTAAVDLVAQGIQLIELCGGFSGDEAQRMRHHIGNAVPVGVVSYSEEQERELKRLFAE